MLIVASGLSNWLSRGFDNRFLTIAGSLISAFISLVIGLGLIRAALAILDGGRPSVEQLVSTKDIGPYIIASLLVAVIVTVGLFLCVHPRADRRVPAAVLRLRDHRQEGRLRHHGAQSSPTGAIRASFEVVAANIGPLILLAVLCFLLNVAGALLCGVGLLVTLAGHRDRDRLRVAVLLGRSDRGHHRLTRSLSTEPLAEQAGAPCIARAARRSSTHTREGTSPVCWQTRSHSASGAPGSGLVPG